MKFKMSIWFSFHCASTNFPSTFHFTLTKFVFGGFGSKKIQIYTEEKSRIWPKNSIRSTDYELKCSEHSIYTTVNYLIQKKCGKSLIHVSTFAFHIDYNVCMVGTRTRTRTLVMTISDLYAKTV